MRKINHRRKILSLITDYMITFPIAVSITESTPLIVVIMLVMAGIMLKFASEAAYDKIEALK